MCYSSEFFKVLVFSLKMQFWCFAYNSVLVKACKVTSISQKILRYANFIAEKLVLVDFFSTCRHLIRLCNEVCDTLPAGMFLLKVNNGNAGAMCQTCSKFSKGSQNEVINVFLVSLLLTSNRFYALFWFFHCSLWTSTCCLVAIFQAGIDSTSRT